MSEKKASVIAAEMVKSLHPLITELLKQQAITPQHDIQMQLQICALTIETGKLQEMEKQTAELKAHTNMLKEIDDTLRQMIPL